MASANNIEAANSLLMLQKSEYSPRSTNQKSNKPPSSNASISSYSRQDTLSPPSVPGSNIDEKKEQQKKKLMAQATELIEKRTKEGKGGPPGSAVGSTRKSRRQRRRKNRQKRTIRNV